MANSRKSNSVSLIERVAAQTAPLLPPHSSILVGLSGGVDSVVLLHLLHKLAPRFDWELSALHVHHGISPNADAWADFCAELCARYLVSLHVEHVDIAPLRMHGIEAAARKLRHAAFAAQACDCVALAHHADDQAETLLLQLLRGAGVRGASAMPVLITSDLPARGLSRMASSSISLPKRPLLAERAASPDVVRPLLHCSRREILDYAAAHQLRWIEDESNADDNYPRNFLRHRVLPLLGEKFPAYRDTLARSAQNFAEASALLDELAQQDAAQAIESDTLAVAALQRLSQPRAKNLLRYFLHSRSAPMPQTAQLDDMLPQLCGARQDAEVCVAYSDWQVRRYRGRVYALRALDDFDPSLVLPWDGELELDWPPLRTRLIFNRVEGRGISLEKLRRAAVTLRLRGGGEALRPYPNAPTRTLKNLLQEHHVPPWQRDRLPLLYCGDELVCVPGVAVAAEYLAATGEAGMELAPGPEPLMDGACG
ncbi:MAG TPA: tRNA lysidine(34) synthetase TilS [Gallionella sp.]|nr:tRNA lysidine(34) synthetase TilS [Gallionella sp.]